MNLYRNPTPRLLVAGFCCALGLLLAGSPALAAGGGGDAENPDLTRGGSIPDGATHDWNLGATGARGWMYSDKLTTIDARQIAITEVAPGSPADGVLEVGDVILGVNRKRFSYDARTEFGKALTQAETEAGRGRLSLIRWRDGGTQAVMVKLPVLGSYSDTAPYDCPKSERIFEQGCEALAERMADPEYRVNPMERSLNALALLASGEDKYLPLVEREAKWAAQTEPGGYMSWWYGYTLMLASEYIMATGDTALLPELKQRALAVANGQSDVGSWGHKFAGPEGRLFGYGMMNAPGLTLTVGLILAREAGVDDPQVDLAIERNARLIRFYAGKGSVPYGDHAPWIQTHDDNGKNGVAALLFRFLGEQDTAEYFSRMSVATHGNARDTGHTGNFFNMTWSMPAINLSGPNATGAWMKEFGGWYYDLARRWDGTFLHQGPPQFRPDSYRGWDCTGAYLLHYAMPLKETRLTGKGKPVVPKVSRSEAQSLIEDGRGWNNKDRNSYYDKLPTTQLLLRLGSWSPVVRERSAKALARRDAEVVPRLVRMLDAPDLHTRYGACVALKHQRAKAEDAVPALMKTLDREDLWLRILAAQAMQGIGEPAKQAVPKLLRMLAAEPGPEDPRAMERRYLSFVLFERRGGLLGRSLEGVDRGLLYEAVRAGLKNEDGRARSAISDSVYSRLSLEEVRPLLPAIHRAVIEPAPSGIMFASGVRVNGLEVLSRHHVAEGLDAAMYLLENQNGWGSENRTPKILKTIVPYGAHAKAHLPKLRAHLEAEERKQRNKRRRQRDGGLADRYREVIEKIEAATDKPELIHIEAGRVGRGPAVTD